MQSIQVYVDKLDSTLIDVSNCGRIRYAKQSRSRQKKTLLRKIRQCHRDLHPHVDESVGTGHWNIIFITKSFENFHNLGQRAASNTKIGFVPSVVGTSLDTCAIKTVNWTITSKFGPEWLSEDFEISAMLSKLH